MAKKDDLRAQRKGTQINITSKAQESEMAVALGRVQAALAVKYGRTLSFIHRQQWLLKDIVRELTKAFPDIRFHHHFDTSSIRPDGGVLFLESPQDGSLPFPVLIAEVKNQGTNDLRAQEGLPRQARGNAIERLGKNLIGLRTAMLKESIFPFVCFGYGCDFEPTSSILDRVSTMAMFGELNVTHLHNDISGKFNRGSFYFRESKWSVDEMVQVMSDIAERSVQYYFSKYGESHFRLSTPI